MKKIVFTISLILICLSLFLTGCVEIDNPQANLQNNSSNTNNTTIPDNENSHQKEPTVAELKTYFISYKATLISNDSVGDAWSSGVLYDSSNVYSYVPVSDTLVSGPTFTLYAIENDKRDDIGKIDITFSNLAIGDKETKIQRLNVRENEGRYIGHTAVWEFTITCSRVDNNYTVSSSEKYEFNGGLCEHQDITGMPREILTTFTLSSSITLAAKITGIPDESTIVVVWILPNNRVEHQRMRISSGSVLSAVNYNIYSCTGNATVQVILEETQELIKTIDFTITE